MVSVVLAALTLAIPAVSPVHLSNTWPAGGALAAMFTTVPAVDGPLPEPRFRVRVEVARLYVAVTAAFAAGMVSVVLAALTLAIPAVSPVHLSNTCPAGGALAAMFTTVPA